MEKSAKDRAFERERTKPQRQVRDARQLAKDKDAEISRLQQLIDEKDDQIRSLNDWIDRLLEFTELSKEDVRKVIESNAKAADALGMLTGLSRMMGGFYGG